MVQKVASIENERRLDHGVVNLLIVVLLELIPLSEHADCVGALGRLLLVVTHY